LDEEGENRVDARGQVAFARETEVSLAVESNGFSLPGSLPLAGRLEGAIEVQARLGDERWQLGFPAVSLKGEVNGLAANASGMLYLDQDWSLAHSDIEVVANGAELQLVGVTDGTGEGRVDLVVEELGRWQEGSRGRVALQGRVSTDQRRLDLEGAMENVEWNELSFERGVISGAYLQDQNQFELLLEIAPLQLGATELSSYRLSASGNEQRQNLRVASEGGIQTEFLLSGSGWGPDWRGSLSPVSLETPHGTWVMGRSLALEWNPDAAHLVMEPHCWKQSLASVCFNDLRLGASGGLDMQANGDLSVLGSLLPVGMEVRGATEVSLAGRWEEGGDLLFEGRTRTRSAVITRHYGEGEAANLTWDRGEGQLRYDGNEASLKWAVHRADRQILDVDLKMPAASDQPIAGQVNVSRLQLEPLIAFLPALSQLRGELTGLLTLAGTREKPLASGDFQLSGGAAALAGNPTPLEGVDLEIKLQGEKALLRGAGKLGGGGVQLEGELALQPDWELKLEIKGERQNILYPPATELLLSEQLTVLATRGLLSVAGDIVVHEGKLEPEQLPEGSVAVSSSVVEVDYRGNVLRERLPFDVKLDVRVVVEDRFKVSTSVLFATLGGELRLQQRPGQPLQLFGSLRIVDGYVSAYKQKLQIQHGTFSFSGRPDNPSINLRAVRNISGSNVVVGMRIQGTYEALSMEVFSDPAMSEGETMSYLVRGRGLDSSAGEDGTALALSVAGGVINRSTLVSELNRIPGINNVSFGADGSNDDTAATVSGFIGDRIYLSYGIGIYEPINVLVARLYLRTRLWLEVVSRLENSVDLYYAFDID
jgi:autotransporter translocation and assembly factor TamB